MANWACLFILATVGYTYAIPQTVPIEVERFEGHWFQVYGNTQSLRIYNKASKCHTATYVAYNDTFFQTLTHQRLATPGGEEADQQGTIIENRENGKYIAYSWRDGRRSKDNYWVMKVGPVVPGQSGLYSYALISDPQLKGLIVLARDTAEFKAKYDSEVLNELRNLGFYKDASKSPISLYHGSDCKYKARPDLSLPTVAPQLDRYLGRWYQMYGNSISAKDYGENTVCNTATYGAFNDSTITVYNSNNAFIPDGIEGFTIGYAFTTPDAGKFLVQLYPLGLFPLPIGSYWVLKVGPTTYGSKGLHQYAVVTGRDTRRLYVLARDPVLFRQHFESEVLQFIDDSGFNLKQETQPISIYHGSDCVYPPEDPFSS